MNKEPIAIIGIGCRIPGVDNPKDFWKLLCDGIDAVAEIPKNRWDIKSFNETQLETTEETNPHLGGFLDRVDCFDADFFGISPREANSIDPQHRLLLEVTWEALEDAGQVPESLTGTQTGVFVGISSHDYSVSLWGNSSNDRYATTGTAHCMAANRISYFFDWNGPSIAVDTACSSSLVAVHLACQSIWNGESSLGVAGGINILLLPKVTSSMTKAGFIAPDGRCKTFDARANGHVRGEGAGVILLKPLSQAQADGDSIYAIIRGSAVNQDGRSNGITAPNLQAQESVLRQAYQQAGVLPSQVQYIEVQGTGTKLGDSVEMKALGKVIGEDRPPGDYCTVGSVKTNIGHLEAASGIVGLIKVALSLKHQQIPPSLHFQQPNPYIPFHKLPLRVQENLTSWPKSSGMALAGVSAFGLGGTNSHVVLEEAPTQVKSQKLKVESEDLLERPVHLLTLSAKTEKALKDLVLDYQNYLETHSESAIADICLTANTKRSHFRHRLAIIASEKQELADKLAEIRAEKETDGVFSGKLSKNNKSPKMAFLFTGEGSQHINMGKELYETQPLFRETLQECDRLLQPYLNKSLLEIIYPDLENEKDVLSRDLTAYTQPAIFAVEYALFKLWQSWGIEPNVVMGQGVGEYVAATVAGIFSLEDGLKLIAHRGRLLMIASEEKVKIELMLAEFKEVANQITYHQSRIPLISNVTEIKSDEAVSTVNYWMNYVRQPLKLASSIETLHQSGYKVFLEIGSEPTLLKTERNCLPERAVIWLSTLCPNGDNWQQILYSLGQLYVQGVKVDWSGFDQNYYRSKAILPTYPFQRERYWIETPQLENQQTRSFAKPKLVPKTNIPYHIFCLSGSNKTELLNLAESIVFAIEQNPEIELENLCFLANTKKSKSKHRLAIVSESTLDLQTKLTDFIEGKNSPEFLQGNIDRRKITKLAFIFSNHGCQYHSMGKELYETQPIFRQAFDECEQILGRHLKRSLFEFLYDDDAKIEFELENIEYSLTSLFTLEYALVQLWKSWGIEPSLVLGISFGEIAAAHSAGVSDLNFALTKLIFICKELRKISLPNNRTIVIKISEEKLEEIVQPYSKDVSIVSYVGSRNVITGSKKAIEKVREELEEQNIMVIPLLKDPYGFHTSNIDRFANKYYKILLEELNLSSIPNTDYLSSVTGKLVGSELTMPEYWTAHLRQPVQISKMAKTLSKLNYEAFLEIGPQATASSAVRKCLSKNEGIWLPSLHKSDSDWKHILKTLGQLYVLGVSINWEGFYNCYSHHQVSLSEDIFTKIPKYTNATPIINSLINGSVERVNQLLKDTGKLSDIENSLTPKILKLLFQQHQKQLNSNLSEDSDSIQHSLTEKQRNNFTSEFKKLSATERENKLSNYLQDCFANILGIKKDRIDVEQSLMSMGFDSIMAIELLRQIKTDLKVDISVATLFQNPSIDNLASFLKSSINKSCSVLVPIKTSGNQYPLFCVHPVGGNVLCYADLAHHLDRNYPVYGLQSFGLDGQQPLTSIEEMASHYIAAIQLNQPYGPYRLIGWSMGGIIAYEMAQQLQARNEPVAFLALIDSYAPTVIPKPSEMKEATIINQFARDLEGLNGREFTLSLETLRELEPDEQVKHLFEQAKHQAVFSSELEIEQVLSLWQVFQTNIIANYHYQPKVYSGSIILLNASETPAEIPTKVIEDPTKGWKSLVRGDIQTCTITGDHYTIIQAPQVKCLTEKLNNHLKLIQNQ